MQVIDAFTTGNFAHTSRVLPIEKKKVLSSLTIGDH
jgi:hypothetical protein